MVAEPTEKSGVGRTMGHFHLERKRFSRCFASNLIDLRSFRDPCQADLTRDGPGFRPPFGQMHPAGIAARGIQRPYHRDTPVWRHDEHHESAAAGAGDLAADCPVGKGNVAQFLDPVRC